jgi:isoleucyl-tRNA synthetase
VSTAAEVWQEVQASYASYDFHKVFHTLHEYCVTDLSVLCIDVLKDRLYCSAKDTKEYASAVTALWHVIELLVRELAPILSFTAEEIFGYLPEAMKGAETTVFALRPVDCAAWILPQEPRDDWKTLQGIRGAVTRAIEPLRREGTVGHALDTAVTIYLDDARMAAVDRLGADMREYCIVSQLKLAPLSGKPADLATDAELEGVAVAVAKAEGEKCPRCWIYSTEIGADPAHPEVCPRCGRMLAKLGE